MRPYGTKLPYIMREVEGENWEMVIDWRYVRTRFDGIEWDPEKGQGAGRSFYYRID